jgi:hypothetical protein
VVIDHIGYIRTTGFFILITEDTSHLKNEKTYGVIMSIGFYLTTFYQLYSSCSIDWQGDYKSLIWMLNKSEVVYF